jgi:hypothetical protein
MAEQRARGNGRQDPEGQIGNKLFQQRSVIGMETVHIGRHPQPVEQPINLQ